MYRDYTFIFDIDGTLCPIKKKEEDYADLVPFPDMVEKLRYYKENGAKIVLFTSRNMNSYGGNIGLINKNTAPVLNKWLEKWDIPYDEIVFGKLWPGHKGFYVDDRSVRPDEFLKNTPEELEKICEASRGGLAKKEAHKEEGRAVNNTKQDKAIAYVDGSYNVVTGEYSYGVVIFYNEKEENFNEKFNDEEMASMRNVAGEIEGAKRAMRYAVENNIAKLDIFFDYEGIRAWCTGEWQAKKEGTKEYKAYYDSIKDKVRIDFQKVKSHSGIKYNDKADKLAKAALGID